MFKINGVNMRPKELNWEGTDMVNGCFYFQARSFLGCSYDIEYHTEDDNPTPCSLYIGGGLISSFRKLQSAKDFANRDVVKRFKQAIEEELEAVESKGEINSTLNNDTPL